MEAGAQVVLHRICYGGIFALTNWTAKPTGRFQTAGLCEAICEGSRAASVRGEAENQKTDVNGTNLRWPLKYRFSVERARKTVVAFTGLLSCKDLREIHQPARRTMQMN